MAPTAATEAVVPDENIGPALVAATAVLTVCIVTTTTARIFVRYRLRGLGWDDWTILAAAVFATIRAILQHVQLGYGNGRHVQYLEPDQVMRSNRLGFYALLLLFASTFFLKTSIILLLLRIKDSRPLKIFLYVIIAGLFITNFGSIVTIIAQCDPPSAYWTGKGKCWPVKVRIYYIYVTIGYSIFTDVLCSLLPLTVIWNVNFALKKKILVWSLMSLGLLATGFGIARAASLDTSGNDIPWTYAWAAIWSNLELYIGITAANLALSRYIYRYLRHGKVRPRRTSDPSADHSHKFTYLVFPKPVSFRSDRQSQIRSTITVSSRALSTLRSTTSEEPLRRGIQVETNFMLHHGEPGTTTRNNV